MERDKFVMVTSHVCIQQKDENKCRRNNHWWDCEGNKCNVILFITDFLREIRWCRMFQFTVFYESKKKTFNFLAQNFPCSEETLKLRCSIVAQKTLRLQNKPPPYRFFLLSRLYQIGFFDLLISLSQHQAPWLELYGCIWPKYMDYITVAAQPWRILPPVVTSR